MPHISDAKWQELSERLQVDEAVLRAVAEVESGGDGFLKTRPPRPKVLFEGHYFHRLTGGRFAAAHPTISFPKWTREHYARTGAGEWARLETAIALDREAALRSASWGAFQIMGTHHAECGCPDVETFAARQHDSVEAQLHCFAHFIARDWYLVPLRSRNWALFAERYNGPGYAKNRYDVKLADAWARHASNASPRGTPAQRRTRRTVQGLPPGRAVIPEMPMTPTLSVEPRSRSRGGHASRNLATPGTPD